MGWRKKVGTWIKAVAIMTPVPKCFMEKNTHAGIRTLLTLCATIGNSAPDKLAPRFSECKDGVPKVDERRIRIKAAI